jgi:hypothetical protein
MRLLLLAGVLLATASSAYHMDGAATAVPAARDTDFLLVAPSVLSCESRGPSDLVNPQPVALPGVGGLCYSGRIAATGTAPPTGPPSKSTLYTRLDVTPADLVFTARLGPYACHVLPAQAFYYDETFAWLTWSALVPGGNGHVAVQPELGVAVPAAIGSVQTAPLAFLPSFAIGCGGAPTGYGPVWVA